jgi:hypothetical protein
MMAKTVAVGWCELRQPILGTQGGLGTVFSARPSPPNDRHELAGAKGHYQATHCPSFRQVAEYHLDIATSGAAS